jgi:hypothetical protein
MKVLIAIFALVAIAAARELQNVFVSYKEGDQTFLIATTKYGEDGNFIIGKYSGDHIYIPYHGKEIAIKAEGSTNVYPLRTNGKSELKNDKIKKLSVISRFFFLS